MLDADTLSQLRTYLERLPHDVQITATLDDRPVSTVMRELLAALRQASDRLTVAEASEAPADLRRPFIAIHRPGEVPRVFFAGVPLGHELASLVLALLHVAGHPPRVDEAVLARLEALPGPLRFETYFSISCQSCPDTVQALNLLAARNPHVTHVAIDGAAFPDEVERRGVLTVPAVFLNGEPFTQGRMDVETLLAKLDASGVAAQALALDGREFDLLVVGGGPAGAAAAIYAARKGIRTGVVTERFGGQVLDTAGIENFVSVSMTEGPALAAALEAHVRHYPVEILMPQRARRLRVDGDWFRVELESGATLAARSLVLAPGATWRNLNVPGEAEYRTRGVTYCPHCDGPLFAGKRVAVIGGGNSGVEAAIDLAGIVRHVTLIEFLDALRADDILQRKLRSLPNVQVVLGARVTEIRGDGKRVTGLVYEERATGRRAPLEVDGIFVQIGLVPNTGWLRGSVELAPSGEIVVDDHGRTSVPGIYAAGDATTVPFKQIVIAVGEGAKAALGAFDYLIRSTAPAAA